ncbi:M60 family metallopeptidase (plasmid) [Bacillus mycoides]|uniref:M60 family metallopeptidase n=1 Tax=Bacillus mycoides TaxID=1405 RepID=UPI003CED6957
MAWITKVSAETQEKTVKKQVSTEHVFQVMGKGNVDQIKDKDRRQFRFSPYEPTGLYASPNEKITILVEGTQNIQAYIGTFSYDAAWDQDSLIKSFTLKPGENTIESPNGGMIYFYNPQQGGTVRAEITAGGAPTPFFELGKHTQQDLVNMLDTYPNAHAVELKGERVLITASPERVKKYLIGSNTDPVQLLKKMDESIRIQDRVSGLSEKEADKHYVHFVEDNHSKDYYMYSYSSRTAYVGDAIQHVLDVNDFTKDGWGPWHEAGHQRQQTPWTWDGLGEVTVNIYSMSVQRAFGSKSRLEKGTYEKAFNYLNKPQSEKDYNKIDDVFVKLAMFWQLDLAFGEEFYPKLHQEYRSLSKEELPKNNEEKIQGFIYNTSKVAKQNLLPFFDKWGLVATPETRQKVEALNDPIITAPIWEATDSKPIKVKVEEPTIASQVSDTDEKDKTDVTLQKKNEGFIYNVKVTLPTEVAGYEALRIYDDIENVIDIEKVTVEDEKGTDISGYGEIKIDKATGKVEFNFAKDKIIEVAGNNVFMKVTGKLKDEVDLSNYEKRIISNTAKVQWNGKEKESNKVTVQVPLLKLGDRVWEDSNRNGIQDQGEKGIEDVRVLLLDKEGNVLKEVKTDKEGNYLFDGLTENIYRVQVDTPPGYVFTLKQSGQDVTVDSNVNETGVTNDIAFSNDNLTFDVGVTRNNNNEPSNNESSNNEPSNNESSNNEPSNNESSNNEPSNNEPGNNESSNNESSNNESSNNESSNNEPGNNESSNNEPSNNESSNNEPGNNESSNNESSNKSSNTENKLIDPTVKQMTNKNGVLPNTGSQISILSLIGVILLLISAVFWKKSIKKI